MAWNEPGGNGKDPWGNRRSDGPPDLDEWFKNLQNKLSGLFGGGSGGGRSGGSFSVGFGFAAVIALLIWGIVGVYIVDEGERGVVLLFGKYVDTTTAGPHWYPPIIQTVEKVAVSEVRQTNGTAQVLTGDENIVQVFYTIQYNVKSARDYLFNTNDPDNTIRLAGESAFREIVGKKTLDYIITEGRKEMPILVKALLQENLDLYGTGLDVNRVTLNDAKAPTEVQEAFDDATKAREDKESYINEAKAYRNDIIPKARGDAQQLIEQAKAYKVSRIKSAEGEAERFTKLLIEYERAPRVTRERLYLETIEDVLANSGKVVVDVEGGNNLMYLPLDKIMSRSGNVYIEALENARDSTTGTQQPSSYQRDNRRGGSRAREVRR